MNGINGPIRRREGRCGEILIDGIPASEIARLSIARGFATPPPVKCRGGIPPKTPAEREAYKIKRRATIARCQADYKLRMKLAQDAMLASMSPAEREAVAREHKAELRARNLVRHLFIALGIRKGRRGARRSSV